jgi:hypothetical protein
MPPTLSAAFVPPSTSPSHYSPAIIGGVISAGAFALLLIVCWIYIAHCGGPSAILAGWHKRKDTKKRVHDIEAANTPANTKSDEQQQAREAALAQLNGLMTMNSLVGTPVPARPKAVDFQEESRVEEHMRRIKACAQLCSTVMMHEEDLHQARA